MINWKVRMRNPMFWAQILLSVIMPILAYLGLTAEDLSSWSVLGEVLIKAVSSPYILTLVIVVYITQLQILQQQDLQTANVH